MGKFLIFLLLLSVNVFGQDTKFPFGSPATPKPGQFAYTNIGIWTDDTVKFTHYATSGTDTTLLMFNSVGYGIPYSLEYLKNLIAANTLTATNGLTKSSETIKLGGSLTETTSLAIAGNTLNIGGATDGTNAMSTIFGRTNLVFNQNKIGEANKTISLTGQFVNINNIKTSSPDTSSKFEISPDSVKIKKNGSDIVSIKNNLGFYLPQKSGSGTRVAIIRPDGKIDDTTFSIGGGNLQQTTDLGASTTNRSSFLSGVRTISGNTDSANFYALGPDDTTKPNQVWARFVANSVGRARNGNGGLGFPDLIISSTFSANASPGEDLPDNYTWRVQTNGTPSGARADETWPSMIEQREENFIIAGFGASSEWWRAIYNNTAGAQPRFEYFIRSHDRMKSQIQYQVSSYLWKDDSTGFEAMALSAEAGNRGRLSLLGEASGLSIKRVPGETPLLSSLNTATSDGVAAVTRLGDNQLKIGTDIDTVITGKVNLQNNQLNVGPNSGTRFLFTGENKQSVLLGNGAGAGIPTLDNGAVKIGALAGSFGAVDPSDYDDEVLPPVIIGWNAGRYGIHTRSVVLGANALNTNGWLTGIANVVIGDSALFGNDQGLSNTLWIANSSTSQPILRGNFANNRLGINVDHAPLYTLEVNGDAGISNLWVGGKSSVNSGYNTLTVGGASTHATVEYYDNNNRIGGMYTTSSSLEYYTETGNAQRWYVNGDLSSPAFEITATGLMHFRPAYIPEYVDNATAVAAVGTGVLYIRTGHGLDMTQ